MAYTLDAFCNDCRDALKTDKGPGGREAVRQLLEKLLANPGICRGARDRGTAGSAHPV